MITTAELITMTILINELDKQGIRILDLMTEEEATILYHTIATNDFTVEEQMYIMQQELNRLFEKAGIRNLGNGVH